MASPTSVALRNVFTDLSLAETPNLPDMGPTARADVHADAFQCLVPDGTVLVGCSSGVTCLWTSRVPSRSIWTSSQHVERRNYGACS